MIRISASRSAKLSSFLPCAEAERRIADQRAIVASFAPGSAAHRTATEVLLLLLDSAHVMAEARETLLRARNALRAG